MANPATLPPVGYLQFEQGYLGSLGSTETASQYGANIVAKLAVHPRVMLTAGTQPYEASIVSGLPGTSHDAGSAQVGLQLVLYAPHQPSGLTNPAAADDAAHKTAAPVVAVGYSHTVYAGTAPDIDVGSSTNLVTLYFSGDVGGFHYDTNYLFAEQDGDSMLAARTVRRGQFGQTLSVNHALGNPNLQMAVELYHFTQPFVGADAFGQTIPRANLVGLLIAPSYQVKPNLVLDFGFEHGFTSTSTRWQSFAGFTYLLPHRLWPERRKS